MQSKTDLGQKSHSLINQYMGTTRSWISPSLLPFGTWQWASAAIIKYSRLPGPQRMPAWSISSICPLHLLFLIPWPPPQSRCPVSLTLLGCSVLRNTVLLWETLFLPLLISSKFSVLSWLVFPFHCKTDKKINTILCHRIIHLSPALTQIWLCPRFLLPPLPSHWRLFILPALPWEMGSRGLIETGQASLLLYHFLIIVLLFSY